MRKNYIMKYTVDKVKKTSRGSVNCILLENGIIIAKVNRPANIDGYIQDYNFKFFSDASKERFETFCNCLSKEETIEALIGIK